MIVAATSDRAVTAKERYPINDRELRRVHKEGVQLAKVRMVRCFRNRYAGTAPLQSRLCQTAASA